MTRDSNGVKIMPTVKVRNLKNKEVGEVTLSDAVFGVELNEGVDPRSGQELPGERPAGNFGDENSRKRFGFGYASCGSRRERAARVSRRFARLSGKAAVTSTDRSRATGHTRCRRKCAAARLRSALSERLREGNLIVIDDIQLQEPEDQRVSRCDGDARP